MSYFFFYLNKLRHFLLFFISIFFLYSCLTTSSGDSVRAITEKGRIDTVYDKKFKGTPEFLAKTYDNGRNWQISLKQTGVFIAMVIWEKKSPGGSPRKGILGLDTTRGDRLFISLLGSAFIHLFWLALVGSVLWIATIICVGYAVIVFRYV